MIGPVVKLRTMTFLEKNKRRIFILQTEQKIFLDTEPKSHCMKEKIAKLNFIKIKTFAPSKTYKS